MKRFFLIIIMTLIVVSFSHAEIDLSLAHEMEHSIKLGLRWLVEQQEDNGSWQYYPAITALTVIAIINSNPNISYQFEPVAKGLSFIASCAKLNGSI